MTLANDEIKDFLTNNLGYNVTERQSKRTLYDVVLQNGEVVLVHISDLSITGTDRHKPQIRLNSSKVKEFFAISRSEGKRFFWLTYFTNTNYQNLGANNSNSSENERYILSLEADPRNINGRREDIRSFYDWLNGPQGQAINSDIKKCNSGDHNNNSIYQGSFIKIKNGTNVSLNKLEEYLNIFDTRQFYLPVKHKNLNYTPISERKKRNVISFGAPGTGKSNYFNKILEGVPNTNYERVTFYSDYTYSQFIGAYKPVDLGGAISYKFVPGPFTKVLVKALKSGMSQNPEKFYLVIEEINRARAASVFGDFFQLLDRTDEGESEYFITLSEDLKNFLMDELNDLTGNLEQIKLPNNLFLYATMNSADQGVFPIDTAFKRRWDFRYIGINKGEFYKDSKNQTQESQGGTFTIAQTPIEWNVLRRAINERLSSDDIKAHEDKLIGPFFMKITKKDGTSIFGADPDNEFIDLFCDKVLMYLFEDAVKTKRNLMFKGITDAKVLNRYSEVCAVFKEKGVGGLFGDDFLQNEYPNQMHNRNIAKSNF